MSLKGLNKPWPGVLFAREEAQWPLTPQQVDAFKRDRGWLPELLPEYRLPPWVRTEDLTGALTVHTVRRSAEVSDSHGFSAELSLDDVTFRKGEAG